MSVSHVLLHRLKEQGIQCYASFPDKWLGPFLQVLDEDPDVLHLPVTIEREALGIAVGAQLAGMRSALVMQNSGIGNLLNDWASLAHNYRLPVPWIVSDRGSAGEQVMTQTIWHGRLRPILQAAGIPVQTCSTLEQVAAVTQLIEHGYDTRQCVAALFPYDFWRADLAAPQPGAAGGALILPAALSPAAWPAGALAYPRAAWRRFEALDCLLDALSDEFLFVTLGDPCKEAYAIQDRDATFYMLGSMGLVLPLGVGFALAHATAGGQRKTVVVDGDGSQLMQLGSLGTLARERPNLALMIIDNGSYGTTGDQPTLTRTQVSLEGIACACGLTNTATVSTPQALTQRLDMVLAVPGPSVTVVRVQPGAPATPLVPLSPAEIALRFGDVASARLAWRTPVELAAGV